MSIHIRKAKLQDVATLSDLLKSLGWFTHLLSESNEMAHQRITHHLTLSYADESHSVYVAEKYVVGKPGGIVGDVAVHWLPYLFLLALEGFVSELFVHESVRGQGIGTQLLEAVKAEAQERGRSRLMLINSRDRESYKRKFYEKQGWKEREAMANFVYGLQQ